MTNDTATIRGTGLLGKLGAMTSIRDTEMLEQSLLRTLGPLLGVVHTSLYRLDDKQTLVRVIHYHRSQSIDQDGVVRVTEHVNEVELGQEEDAEIASLIERVTMLGKPCTRLSEQDYLVVYPMLGGNVVRGFFVFRRERELTANEDTMVRGVLEVFSNYYSLLDVSQRDRLTSLLNRQALENNFERIWSALLQTESPNLTEVENRSAKSSNYWLAVIDIDHFKRINDTFGHMVGDEILLLVSRLMQSALRASDLLYRYGGEEFVAIICAENEAIANNVFERVRLAIEAHNFPRVEKVSISVGYVQVDASVLPIEVLSRADRSLYQAKQDGRNRVYDFQQLVDSGVFAKPTYTDAELF
ncbi:MAG: GGDEF domain-containing protein [Gammaproteobacteria bacterium]|nr:GGDEF domain-containing protein [Gammaproteobacteria bacterium]